jgi:hypothetical protein
MKFICLKKNEKTHSSYLTFLVFSLCVPKQEKIERIIEDGIEVIVNHLEPCQIKGESITLTFKEEFLIDSEIENLADLGSVKNHIIKPTPNFLLYEEI